jgi:hypothetical protein
MLNIKKLESENASNYHQSLPSAVLALAPWPRNSYIGSCNLLIIVVRPWQ